MHLLSKQRSEICVTKPPFLATIKQSNSHLEALISSRIPISTMCWSSILKFVHGHEAVGMLYGIPVSSQKVFQYELFNVSTHQDINQIVYILFGQDLL